MDTQNQHLDALQDIKKMMERSSRFISLSGLSGIAAGSCALIGAWLAHDKVLSKDFRSSDYEEIAYSSARGSINMTQLASDSLKQIATITFIAALVLAFLFTYLRSKKEGITLWGKASKRLMFNVAVPMIVGGVFILKIIEHRTYGFVAPGCLIFYGLSLFHASKYTLGEVRYLGLGQIILGLINLWFVGYGLYFWAAGFGVLHIVYGAMMWWKYERN